MQLALSSKYLLIIAALAPLYGLYKASPAIRTFLRCMLTVHLQKWRGFTVAWSWYVSMWAAVALLHLKFPTPPDKRYGDGLIALSLALACVVSIPFILASIVTTAEFAKKERARKERELVKEEMELRKQERNKCT